MQIGLLGKANVGKSTFFSAATETSVPIGNFPFTTIEPNVGVTHIKTDCACKHFGISHNSQFCINGTRFVPVKLIDIAGLVPDAHKGKGLGNQFLDDARQADALIHVVDIAGTTDIQGQPVSVGSHDPLEDVKFVEEEFVQWFNQILKREWQKISKEIEQKTTKLVEGITKRFSGLGIKDFQVQSVLQHTGLQTKKISEWNDDDLYNFAKELRKITKPILIAANKADLCKDLSVIKKIQDTIVIPCSAESELLLRKASKSGMIEYVTGSEKFTIKENSLNPQQKKALDLVSSVLEKITTTGIQSALNKTVFDLLKFIVVYPVEDETKFTNKDGEIFPDAKLLPLDSTAKELAKIIHADIAKGFLHAIDCKTKQRIGADHKLKNGDVIKIVSSMSRG
ncbi:MAG: redox-regulated ATPase YchF [Crenarchaeota archaeon]|nr:MAG: redox-regulated ATPase YchF [Thermoproteota archaeon]RDJ33528.1 MAG: redox-regulated ATPase YchF [Thermoproteota archaeon]RDJ38152.1 MAG: redox-regulated ATPase YchF [Thermoproteota archaeon]RDJ39080.1 MAG: redox-regulated ATPase YchF [Thermoproteota archaeon]